MAEEPEVNYTEIINELEEERERLKAEVEVSRGNELGMARMLVEYLVRERDALRGVIGQGQE